MVAALVRIRCFSNSYKAIAVIFNSSNGVGIILLNKITQLLVINAKLICMVAFYAFVFNRQDIGINSNGSNGVGILSIVFNEALQSFFIDTDLIIFIIRSVRLFSTVIISCPDSAIVMVSLSFA